MNQAATTLPSETLPSATNSAGFNPLPDTPGANNRGQQEYADPGQTSDSVLQRQGTSQTNGRVETPRPAETPTREYADAPTRQTSQSTPADNSDGGSQFSPEAVQLAQRYRISEQQVRENFGSEEELRFHLGRLDQALAANVANRQRMMQSQAQPPAPSQQPPQQQQPEAGQGSEHQEQQPNASQSFAPDWGDDPDEVNEHVVRNLDGLSQYVTGQLQQLQNSMTAVVQAVLTQQSAHDQNLTKELDDAFGSLGDKWTDLFGNTPPSRMIPGTPEHAAWSQMKNMMDTLEYADVNSGMPKDTITAYQQRALWSLYPDRLRQSVREEVAHEANARRQQAIHRPTQRQGVGQGMEDGEAKAARRANEFYAEKFGDRISGSQNFLRDGV